MKFFFNVDKEVIVMGFGIKICLFCLFFNLLGNFFGGVVDYFVGYGNVCEGGLVDLLGVFSWVMVGGFDYVSI